MIESIDDLIIFLKHFHRHLLTDPSLPPERIPDYLPEGLAKIYRELGGFVNLPNPHPFGTQDKLVHVSNLQYIEDGMVAFCWENQAVWSARCPINQKDPPVYSDHSDYDGWNLEGDFVVVCESLNHFLITFCLQEAFFFGTRNSVTVENADNILEIFLDRERFQPLWLDGQYVYRDWLKSFYISEDRDILMWDGWIVSHTHTLLDLFDPNIDPKIKVKMFGVDLPRRYWTKFSKWKAEWLLDEENVEIRRVLIQQIGYDRICQELDAIDLDDWREYTLLSIEANVEDEPMVLLKMTCPSTGHIHILRVPPEMTSAEAAITWVNHGIHPDKFAVQT
ncbi:DUF6745 domain-containing protein [Chamaesiphon sp. GL140_3_metabinner_50]|uniref:DUF6745 domain-containing protein n=1 Tax=Chamaesiphon sp. GL140_3_metabinner_50 TaxID=2970812 RepID=UPI0025E9D952|nr:hypothetical protein [Chamaesiphon sp. GL140_3_metabinner_50]